jgi:hypothetical protein
LVLEQVFLLWCLTQGCDIFVMARRWRRNTDSVDVESELAELRQSNQALQQMMNEIIHRIPASPNQSQGSVYVLLQLGLREKKEEARYIVYVAYLTHIII